MDTQPNDVEAMEAALERYKKENKKFREERDEALSKVEELEGKINPLREAVVKGKFNAALAEAGVKNADRFSRYVDYEKIELDDNGEVKGLDEQIDSLKSDFPEFFDPKKRVGGGGDQFEKEKTPTPVTTEDLLVKQFNEARR